MSHARLSPSAAERWMNCPGSVNLTAGMSESTSEYAQEGTNAHFLLEYCLKNNQGPLAFIGQVVTEPDSGVEFDVTKDMADAVNVAHAYIMDRYYAAHAAEGGACDLYPEMKVMPTRLMRLDCEGTSDTILVTPWYVEVIDYKHGAGIVVEIPGNRQLQIYGIGSLDTLGIDLEGRPLVTTIIQPRAPHIDGPVRSVQYTEAEVAAYTAEIMLAASATDDPNAPIVPGDEQCRWCKAKATCKTLADTALSGAAAVFTDLTVTTSAEIEANTLRDPALLTPEQTTIILQNEALIKSWLVAVHKNATNTLLGGGDVPGFKLTAGKRSREWNMADDELGKMLRSIKRVGGGKVTVEDIHVSALKSPAQIEKMLKSTVTKAAWKKIDAAITMNDGSPQLTPASSSKPAILTKASEVFEDLTVPSFLS